MTKKEEIDIEEEVRRVSRKSNYNMIQSEYSFNKQLKKLDDEIDNVINDKYKEFKDNKKATEEYSNIEFKHETIDRYREKLRKL
ncbi:MAG: hypothetical protein E7Z80_07690 [Methanobrevibacter thaueri]|nr:hypothetical protein [Methanobrevibacter thaueri]